LSAANLAKARLRGAWLQRANLSSANLQEANLRGARLQRANLSGANLSGANLSGANLQAARLRTARLQKANLSGANLQETRLGLARLQRADLSGANLQRTRLKRARLQGANLSGAVLEKTVLEKARLRDTVLRQAQVTEINLSERRLRKLDLSGAVLTNVNLSGVNAPEITLHGAQGREVDLSRARLRQADLSGANFPGVNMDRARLRAANLRGVRLTGADLSGTRLQEADLRGADLRHSLMSPETLLDKIRFDNLVCLAGLRWNGVQLDGVDWDYVTALGDETLASKLMGSRRERVAAIQEAMRAYHGVTVALRNQGINIPASRFRLREQRVEQKLLRMQGKVLPWLGSLLLDWMAGYGEALGRIFATYLGVVLGFSGLYWWLTNHVLQHATALQWYEAIALSFSTFHGRGFFTQTINLGEALGLLAVVEAVVGIFIEIILIAAFARRFLDG